MQETLKVKRGTAWLRRFEGVVLHSDRDLETQVAASGGGGYVGPSGGYVAAPRITSTTSDHQAIFARNADGAEMTFQWSNWTLPVRPGTRIAVLWGARVGVAIGPFFGVINLDTGDERWGFDRWIQAQGLVSARIRGWTCFFLSVLIACVLVYAYAYTELNTRPRPEQKAFDEAQLALGKLINDHGGIRGGRLDFGSGSKTSPLPYESSLAFAYERLDQAGSTLRDAKARPFDPKPSIADVAAVVVADGRYAVGAFWAWLLSFAVLLVFAAIATAVAAARSAEDHDTEARVRSFLRTGVLPP